MRRRSAVALLVIGLALLVAPLAFTMFDRGPAGAEMLDDFEPFMARREIEGFQRDIRQIDDAVRETHGPVRRSLEAGRAAPSPALASFEPFNDEWPGIRRDFDDLLTRVHRSVDGYEAVAALPSFSLFPWFFVIPGTLLAVLGVLGLVKPRWPAPRIAAAVVGVGLVLAPFAFQMFERAPKGARMMDDFETIMTTDRVHTIQGYFGTMAVGEGAIRTQALPALRAQGLDTADIRRQFPAVATLERRWVRIMNDMTPMLGAMSDNVGAYQGIAALPPFDLFPWFFVVPGALAVAFALTGRPQPIPSPIPPRRSDATSIDQPPARRRARVPGPRAAGRLRLE